MQKWTDRIKLDLNKELVTDVFTENALFFDIETTGFSPASTFVYLIGCARRVENQIIIDQYFAESKEDEIRILQYFLKLMEQYKTLITFNGIGFDIPYLKAKCEHYQLAETFADKEYLDLFKIVSSLKFLLKLPNYKQKSIEAFLGIERKDTFSGGELIQVYEEYVKHRSENQMFFLKQHNYEDVLGMLDLLPILSYKNFFMGGFSITDIASNTYRDFEGNEQKELIFTLKNDIAVPKRVSYCYQDFYLICNEKISKLSVHLYEGELKFFFENYKDYFYLPVEDIAIHKDVASFVNKDYRKKATASTCYTRKTSLFLPQCQPVIKPFFCKNYKDKVTYFELSDEFINSPQKIRHYIEHIIKQMSLQKH